MSSSAVVIQRREEPRWGRNPGGRGGWGLVTGPAESAAGGEGHAAYYRRVGPRRVRKSVARRFLVERLIADELRPTIPRG